MPGITTTAGTSWPVRPLAEVTRPLVWPQPRKSFAKRARDQFQTRWDPAGISSADVFDFSAMSVDPFEIGYVTQTPGGPRTYAKRYVPITFEWRNMPADRTIKITNGYGTHQSTAASGDGSATGACVLMTFEVGIVDGSGFAGPYLDDPYFVEDIDYPVTGSEVVDILTVSSTKKYLASFVEELDIKILRTSDLVVLKDFYFDLAISTTITPLSAASLEETLADSGRSVRVFYDGSDYGVLTPGGWAVS